MSDLVGGTVEQRGPLGVDLHLQLRRLIVLLRLLWNTEKMEFTNSPEANKFVRREQYRPGWEKIIG